MEKMPIEMKKVFGSDDAKTGRKGCPEFRVSFPHVFQPKAFKPGQLPKYSMVMLFPKTTNLDPLKKAVFNAATERWGDKSKWPKNLRMPFRDGDEFEDRKGYPGHIFVSATAKERPGLVDQRRERIQPETGNEVFYAGCYARASLIAFAYDESGNKGVSFTLQNIQKLRDGERFSGKKDAEDEFESVDDGSENTSSYAEGVDANREMGVDDNYGF